MLLLLWLGVESQVDVCTEVSKEVKASLATSNAVAMEPLDIGARVRVRKIPVVKVHQKNKVKRLHVWAVN